jgi:2-dehydropantoate 2-reductase
MRFGRADKKPDAKLQAFADAATAAKLDVAISPDITRELWQKFIFLTAMSGTTAALRSPIGTIRDDPELRAFFRALMQEAFAVGKAKGVALDPTYIDQQMTFMMEKVEPGMKASMAHDLERGNRLELDWLAGKVRALGRELGIPTPASDTVYTVLKLHRMGNAPRG